ncbi:MAG: CoA transferase [Chloroflexota bacterium]|nr:CoA transferase [Chloroflexota bacterium]
MSIDNQALSDLKVLDLTRYIAVLYCTKLLADYGTDRLQLHEAKGSPS